MLNKRSGLQYEDVRDLYENFRARCASNTIGGKRRSRRRRSELGCTEPLVGEKAKCVLKIVPQNKKCKTLEIDKKCIKRHGGDGLI